MKQPITNPVRPVERPSSGLSLGDVYYTLFRHKWKIVLVFLAGIVAAAGLYLAKPPMYQSQSKILIRFILESKNPVAGDVDARVKSPDSRGENIINSEIEILTSFDLAILVADVVGPEKILARLGGGNDRLRAAGVVRQGLLVEVPRSSNVLLLTFRHPDATVVQSTLSALVDTYLKRHVEIHQGVGVLDDFFLRQADQLRARLADTESQLKKLRADAQIISLDESKRGYIEQITKLSDELRSAEAELMERRITLTELGKSFPTPVVETNAAPALDPAVTEDYRQLAGDLTEARRMLSALRDRYTDEHFHVRHVQQRVTDLETRKAALESEHPQLVRLAPVAVDAPKPPVDLGMEALRVAGLEARIKVLTDHLEQVRTAATRVMDVEPTILELQRKREVDEANFRFYSTSLEQARMGESLGAGKITNITVVQTPSPPGRDLGEIQKPMLLILLVGCLGGFAWGFVSDRFLNQTIKGVVDIERHLQVPLFITVPDLGWRKSARALKSGRNGHAPPALPAAGEAPAGDASRREMAPWEAEHGLYAYFEGLRDRLITHFEIRGMNHKPKLVAVTSCTPGAGVTTTAAGLAAALSETGDGNVLLVDMNQEQGAVRQFYHGKPARGLAEALEAGNHDDACVAENFYLVTAHETNNQKLPRVLPKRFASLVPKMKASDFDYIIFDMPPVMQTSVTARLSAFMDMVLMVIESEKTGREVVQRAQSLLHESRANVATVLNKHRAYVPKKLSQEL
jgi:uncharacterized protein involved in exopolysaccharide biosynthesis/Mrp family chromosome partitioning ATPase